MDWKAQRPAIEIAAELAAAAALGGAIGFAVWALSTLGTGLVAISAASLAAVLGASAAWWVIRRVDRAEDRGARFVPVDYHETADVLLLEEPLDGGGILLLDDPLPVLDTDSRVVQLFAAPVAAPVAVDDEARPGATDQAALPAPGELVARIEDFLGGARSGGAGDGPSRPAAADASAALHAALADIRRSLRQG